MVNAVKEKTVLKGGEFIIKSSLTEDTFIPEEMGEEQLMVRDTLRDFVDNEVRPNLERMEVQEEGLSKSILGKVGELGLLGSHMPERYGGMDMDFITNTVIGEEIGRAGCFSVTFNAHTGIGMLPILYFGTEAQKEKYLPKLIMGEWAASYCLTEPGSGSDALAAKTKAILSEDGKYYVLNGQKMWITNAGFADIFIIFAQVDGDKFTGFIVEKGMEGLSLGEEEKKLGIKGSSTRMVFLENVKVPVENLLGEIGKGHQIAFNVLNTGRYKLGVSVMGGVKNLSTVSVKYANERHQFGVPISTFGAIKYKLAQQAIRGFVIESSIYRTAYLVNQKIKELKEEGAAYAEAKLKAAEEYALECSIIKIDGSEALDYAADETVQIHGGMGFSEEGLIARAYRDARINRIYEGTNEINRLVIMSTLLKRAMKGKLDIVTPALAAQSELKNGIEHQGFDGEYAEEQRAVENHKKILLMVLGSAAKLAMEGKLDLKKEQELLTNLSDVVIDIFNEESTLLRVKKLSETGRVSNMDVYNAILRTQIHDANFRISKNATDCIASFVKVERQNDFVYGIRKFSKYPLQNVKSLRRTIAHAIIEANEYPL